MLVDPGAVLAQHEQHEHGQSPYAGQEASEIPSLTATELEGLLSGAGMGFAKPAELNHYPGPRHVLDMAEELGLTDEQRHALEDIHTEMKARAIQLGKAIVDAERTLDRRFKHQHIDDESLSEMIAEIAGQYGELRYAHLRAHLATTEVLSKEQVAEYDRLRGYAASP